MASDSPLSKRSMKMTMSSGNEEAPVVVEDSQRRTEDVRAGLSAPGKLCFLGDSVVTDSCIFQKLVLLQMSLLHHRQSRNL